MSMDRSLRSKSMLERHHNVLTRAERLGILKETGLWSEGDKVSGLAKVAHRKAAVGKKDKAEKKPEGAEGAPAAAAEPAPAAEKEKPAKAAKPAKGEKSK
ncbi:MAG: small basic protein [Planctomycetota bacterium]